MTKYLIAFLAAASLFGCANQPPVQQTVTAVPAQAQIAGTQIEIHPVFNYEDRTIDRPFEYFQPTPQSRAIVVGSEVFARAAACQVIQRYKIRTNADFTSSMNLFKYRAYEMGGQRVVILHHSEINSNEPGWSTVVKQGRDVFLREGTTLEKSQYFTTIIGYIYDCPCNMDVCKSKQIQ